MQVEAVNKIYTPVGTNVAGQDTASASTRDTCRKRSRSLREITEGTWALIAPERLETAPFTLLELPRKLTISYGSYGNCAIGREKLVPELQCKES